jgi:hypothetical protein
MIRRTYARCMPDVDTNANESLHFVARKTLLKI